MRTFHAIPYATRQVFKYVLKDRDMMVQIPGGGVILAMQEQNGSPCIWVLVYPDAPVETRRFIRRGTGSDIPHNIIEHLGTYQTDGGAYVLHVFEAALG